MKNEVYASGKIILTTHSFAPNNDGVANVNKYLCLGLAKRGYKIVVVTHKNGNQKELDHYEGVEVHRVYEPSVPEQYVNYILGQIGKNDVLINVCTQTPTTDLLLRELRSIRCKKKILYVHGIWHFGWTNRDKESFRNCCSKVYNNFKWWQYYRRNGKYFKQYDVVTQLHEMDEGALFFKKNYGIRSEIVENAADDAFFEKSDDSAFLNKYQLPSSYLVCVANYSSHKNQEMVLRAYFKSCANAPLVFVGNGNEQYLEHLKAVEAELAKEQKDDRSRKKVLYFRHTPRGEIACFVRNARVFLFGSIGEKFPVSIVEAMAARVPFVSTDVGVVKYLPGGIVVDINDYGAMATAIDRLLDDGMLWEKLSSEGAQYARKRMRIQEKVDQLAEIIELKCKG